MIRDGYLSSYMSRRASKPDGANVISNGVFVNIGSYVSGRVCIWHQNAQYTLRIASTLRCAMSLDLKVARSLNFVCVHTSFSRRLLFVFELVWSLKLVLSFSQKSSRFISNCRLKQCGKIRKGRDKVYNSG